MNFGYRQLRRRPQRPQPLHAGPRARAESRPVYRHRRDAGQEQGVVQPVLEQLPPLADAEHQRRTRQRPDACGSARHAAKDRRPERATSISTTRRRSIRRCASRRAINGNDASNLGIGQWDEETRAYTRDSGNGFIRLQQIGPLGRRAFLRTRFQFAWTDTTNRLRHRSADDSGQRRIHERRRANGRRPARQDRRLRVGSRLRARQPHLPRRSAGRRVALAFRRSVQLSRHLHLRKPRRPTKRARRAATPAASAIRTFATTTCRARSTPRTTFGCGGISR